MIRRLMVAALLLTGTALSGRTQSPAAARATPILNHRALLTRQTWWDNRDWSWYEANIPFFESPDADIDATYYYRWELVTKHLTYGSPETGYTFTEFIDRPFWSGAYGAISCPLGHQLYEVRWLNNHRIVEDFARYWFETPGAAPRSYSNWYGDAVFAAFMVNGDRRFLGTVLPHMEAQYAGWMAEHWDSTRRMFHWDGMHDGMEVNINSRLTTDEGSGADGYRPTINSYLFADAVAISRAAALLGQPAKSSEFAARAADLKARVQRELWDPKRQFFFHQFRSDEQGGITAGSLTYQSGTYAGNPHGREEIGFVPWQFNLPDAGYEAAWKFLMDTSYFYSAYGPTTVERHDPQFLISPRCCVWSGNAWPYATTQTLVAMANLLDNYHQSVVNKADYFKLFKTYTLSQRKDGRPYIAEAANPDNGSWDGHNTFDHSEHYFHSGYVDLVITGIVGLRPRADDSLEVQPLAPDRWDYFAVDNISYHGHQVAVVWDRTGTRYNRGVGLTLIADGRVIGQATGLRRLVVVLPAAGARGSVRGAADAEGATPGTIGQAATVDGRPRATPAGSGNSAGNTGSPGANGAKHASPLPVNIAVNNGHRPYPLIRTSYTAPGTSPHYLIDGNYWYHTSPPNRWTTAGSPNRSDWISLEFVHGYLASSVALYFLEDSVGGIRPPLMYELQQWRNGIWVAIPGQHRVSPKPAGRQANIVSFPPTYAERMRIVLTPRLGMATGLTEIEVWRRRNEEADYVTPACSANLATCTTPSASFTSQYDQIGEINDMVVAFSHYSRNRWTAFGSPNASDWVEVDFHGPNSRELHHQERIEQVDLYLWGDGSGVKAPKRYTIQAWDGTSWVDARVISQVPLRPQVSSINTVRIAPVTTDRLRVVFEHDLPAGSGLTEIMIWGAHR